MTRIEFHVLPGDDAAARLAYVCLLAEQAHDRRQSVFIHSGNPIELDGLDALLWTFRADAFVPHERLDDNQPAGTLDADLVQLSCGEPGPDRRLLINLDDSVPPFFSRMERLLEVVDQTPAVRDAGRERYRFYQHRGYPLTHRSV